MTPRLTHGDNGDDQLVNESANSNESKPPPRAFAQGTGVLLQVIGGILFFSSCCVCSAFGSWDPTMTRGQALNAYAEDETPGYTFATMFDQPGQAGVALHVAFSTVGGLGMMVFGLGLQAEKRKSGWGAVIACAATTAVVAVAAVFLWSGDASWGYRLWNLVVMLVTAVLTGFSIAALRQMLRNPPPDDLYTVPHDFDPKKPDHH